MSPFANRSFRAGRALLVVLLTITAAISATFTRRGSADAAAHRGGGTHLSTGRRHRAAARFLHFSMDSDTVSTVLVPQTAIGPSPYGVQTYVYSFNATAPSSDLYVLEVVNGVGVGGTPKVTEATVTLNGSVVLTSEQFKGGTPFIQAPLSVQNGSNTLVVTVIAPSYSKMAVTVLSNSDPGVAFFGPDTVQGHGSIGAQTVDTFIVSTRSGVTSPYALQLSAISDPDSVTVILDGTTIVHPKVGSPAPLSQQNDQCTIDGTQVQSAIGLIGSAKIPITLHGTDTLIVVTGRTGDACQPFNADLSYGAVVSITGSDTTPPVLTINSPVANSVTNQHSVTISGSVSSLSPVTVAVNTFPVSLGSGNTFSTTVALSELANGISISATNHSGVVTDSVRTVDRDTVVPTFSIRAPLTGRQVGTTLRVAGTVHGEGCLCGNYALSVSANGVVMPVQGTGGSTGSFSGTIPLTSATSSVVITGTDQAGNVGTVTIPISRDSTGLQLTVTGPTSGTTTTSGSVAVTGSLSDSLPVTLFVNGAPFVVSDGGGFSQQVSLALGSNTLTIVARDAAGSTSATRTVTRVPPDTTPEPVIPDTSVHAPSLSKVTPTPLVTATKFLYTGSNPIQTGVSAGTMDSTRALVVRGRVLDRTGAPVGGVTISAIGHPEFGSTQTTSAGQFTMAVNGGSALRLSYSKSGYIAIERQANTSWLDYMVLPDATMIPRDSAVTSIDFTQPAPVARASTVTDADGTRRSTLIFRQGTVATMTLPNNTVDTIVNPSVRATEFTVGTMGPQTMPAPLPPMSAYTYALDLSVDQAVSAGATTTQFSQPVSVYAENFIGFPVGTRVPLGFYDTKQGAWVPEPNGRVIEILSVSGGTASIDVAGSGTAADTQALDSLGFTTPELRQLATVYAAGTTLSRFQVSHFSGRDPNYPNPKKKSPKRGPSKAPPKKPHKPKPHDQCGSIIGCEGQTLGEEIELVGAPYRLRYESDRTPGYLDNYRIQIPLTDTSAVDPDLQQVTVQVNVAGRVFVDSLSPASNLMFNFIWDGKDAFGRTLLGTQPATIQIGYLYACGYAQPPQGSQVFGLPSDSGTVTVPHSRGHGCPVYNTWTTSVGGWDARADGLGGWTLDVHHAYDPVGRVLYLGDGDTRDVASIGQIIKTATGVDGDPGLPTHDTVPAQGARLQNLSRVRSGFDGSVYINAQSEIYRLTRDGQTLIHIAGILSGFPGIVPGSPATQSSFQSLGIAPDRIGGFYFSDQNTNTIEHVDSLGILTVFAGNGTSGHSGDGGPALSAAMRPRDMALGADGTVYFADGFSYIRSITPDGIVHTIAGNGGGYNGDGQPAVQAGLSPMAIDVGPDGSIYETEWCRLRKITTDGYISTLAGTGNVSADSDGMVALKSNCVANQSVAVGRDGTVYFAGADTYVGGQYHVWSITTDGILHVIAGNHPCPGYCQQFGAGNGDGGTPLHSELTQPVSLAVLPDSSVVVADNATTIRKISPPLAAVPLGNVLIPSEDGQEVYQFTTAGQHVKTLDALTGVTLYTFGYDSTGALTTITDRNHLTTRITRASGAPTGIVGPFGQTTALSVDGNGYLSSVTDPASETITPQHGPDGLLHTYTDARGSIFSFVYDSLGRLAQDADPIGSRTLSIANADTSYTVSFTSAAGRLTQYTLTQLSNLTLISSTTDPSGVQTVQVAAPDGSETLTAPDGTVYTARSGVDPRFGSLVPLEVAHQIVFPSGPVYKDSVVRHTVLSDSTNPLSLTFLVDSISSDGLVTVRQYSASTRTLTTISPMGRTTTQTFDSLGREVSRANSGYAPVTFNYDSVGRVRTASDGGRRTTFTYDSVGRLSTWTDALGLRTTYLYDAANNWSQIVYPNGRSVTYTYDASGQVTSVTPPGRPAYASQMDALGRDTATTAPAVPGVGTTTRFTYDADGALLSIVNPDQSTIAYERDAAGRVTNVTTPDDTISYVYNAGLLASTTFGGEAVSLTYNGSRPIQTTWSGPIGGSVAITFDSTMLLTSVGVDGATPIPYKHDRDGLVTSAGSIVIGRDSASGEETSMTVGNIVTSLQYSLHGNIVNTRSLYSSTALLQSGITYDSLGRVTQETDTIQGVPTTYGYQYDSLGQLTAVTQNGSPYHSFQYDSNGNRTAFFSNSPMVSATYDAQDRMLTYGAASYTYTQQGALLTKAVGTGMTRYTYDAFGNLKHVVLSSGTTIDYIVDGENRRVGRILNGHSDRAWLYSDNPGPVAELDSVGNVVSQFVYAASRDVPDYMIKGGHTYMLIRDVRGSVRLVVDSATGTVAQRIDYDEFGIASNSNPGFQPFGFAGGLYDDSTQLVHFGARDYDPTTGRWTNQDPIRFNGNQSNLYLYTQNDPVNFVDPMGLKPKKICPPKRRHHPPDWHDDEENYQRRALHDDHMQLVLDNINRENIKDSEVCPDATLDAVLAWDVEVMKTGVDVVLEMFGLPGVVGLTPMEPDSPLPLVEPITATHKEWLACRYGR